MGMNYCIHMECRYSYWLNSQEIGSWMSSALCIKYQIYSRGWRLQFEHWEVIMIGLLYGTIFTAILLGSGNAQNTSEACLCVSVMKFLERIQWEQRPILNRSDSTPWAGFMDWIKRGRGELAFSFVCLLTWTRSSSHHDRLYLYPHTVSQCMLLAL